MGEDLNIQSVQATVAWNTGILNLKRGVKKVSAKNKSESLGKEQLSFLSV